MPNTVLVAETRVNNTRMFVEYSNIRRLCWDQIKDAFQSQIREG